MNIKQQQNLLAYLGYYTGAIDGVWGKQSEKATKEFQRAHDLDDDGVIGKQTEAALKTAVANDEFKTDSQPSSDSQSDDVFAGNPYFTRGEFTCRCGCGLCDMDKTLIDLCVETREHFDAPFIPSSGHRCPTHNARVGGVWNSDHLGGRAVDFRIEGKKSDEVLPYVQSLPGIVYAYPIDDDYVHMNV